MRIYFRLMLMTGLSVGIIFILGAVAFLGLRSQQQALDRIWKRDVVHLQAAGLVERLALDINCRAYKIFNLMRAGGDKPTIQKDSARNRL